MNECLLDFADLVFESVLPTWLLFFFAIIAGLMKGIYIRDAKVAWPSNQVYIFGIGVGITDALKYRLTLNQTISISLPT